MKSLVSVSVASSRASVAPRQKCGSLRAVRLTSLTGPGGQQDHAGRQDLLQGDVLDREQRADEIVARVLAPFRQQRGQEQHQLDGGRHAVGEILGRGVHLEEPEQRGRLRLEQLGPLGSDVEQLGDDRDRDKLAAGA